MATAKRLLGLTLLLVAAALLLRSSAVLPGDQTERVRAFTRDIEFDYVTWTADALAVKIGQIALGAAAYLPEAARRQLAQDYLELIVEIQRSEAELSQALANPDAALSSPDTAVLRSKIEDLHERRARMAPLAEAVIQQQLSGVAADMGLSIAGQPFPPILYHTTPVPNALIVSPRDAIRQDQNISLLPDLSVDDKERLEGLVDSALDVSSLVVGIGGVGMYPTMVMQTSDLNWLTEVVAHEWVHNYLTLRPLGINYFTSPELRIINETVASIAGKEIGRAVMEKHYPELLPPEPESIQPPARSPQPTPPPDEPPPFDFRAEMRTTRVEVDRLLAEGKIEEAEEYMEARRAFFWENGYRIRKLNQAYFAFYGAYADEPGGAAGEDPVGAAVRQMRLQSGSLAEFLNRVSWITSFEQLQRAVEDSS